MSTYYLDTSALVKVYVAETGHDWMRAICRPRTRNALFVSQLSSIELEVALARKALERSITEADREVWSLSPMRSATMPANMFTL